MIPQHIINIAMGVTCAIFQHHENVDSAIDCLIDLYHDGVDIGDRKIFNAVMERYGLLDDGFCSEEEYIIKEVRKRII